MIVWLWNERATDYNCFCVITYNSIRTEFFLTSMQQITYQFLYCRPLLHSLTQVLITHIPITSYSIHLLTIQHYA